MKHSLSSSGRLGVDLVELERAKYFYKTHKKTLLDYFSPREVSFIESCQRPIERLAIILGAKEALFKASGSKKPSVLEFRTIEIIPGKKKFSYKLKGTSKKNSRFDAALEISIIRTKKYTVVQCYPKKISI
jgi:phosphopantetheine--protein transferase-like protein